MAGDEVRVLGLQIWIDRGVRTWLGSEGAATSSAASPNTSNDERYGTFGVEAADMVHGISTTQEIFGRVVDLQPCHTLRCVMSLFMRILWLAGQQKQKSLTQQTHRTHVMMMRAP